MKLCLETQSRLGPDVAVPAYARADLRPGIVHVGLGNFHRAHQAVYLDDLFNRGLGHDWAIVGAGVRAGDGAMRDRLAAQDWLTTVVELDPAAHGARVTGVMTDFLPVVSGNGPLVAAMSDPATRIVSLTVTEGGYYIDAATGHFDPTHPDIVADVANPQAPGTVFGAIIAALRQRRAAGIAPFTVMSCDNLPGNGHVTQAAVQGLAALVDPDLAAWITGEVAFPNAMVDRITPATGPREIAMLATEFGIDDASPVFCEPFRQWVMEDRFTLGRPALEEVGVTFTDRVEAFETMKIRILNGGHAIIAYPAGILGIEFVHEAMAHPLIAAFLRKVEIDDILPIVPSVPDTDTSAYLTLIENRFANPEVGDTVRRLCLDGTNRQPKFILPSVRDNLAAGRGVDGLALVSALWCRYCFGTDEAGSAIAPNDPDWDRLVVCAQAARQDPAAWLAMADIYGDLAQAPAFADAFARALAALWSDGTQAVLRAYVGDAAA